MLNAYLDIQNVYNRANPEGVAVQLQLPPVQAPAGPAAPDHPRHPGGVLSHADHMRHQPVCGSQAGDRGRRCWRRRPAGAAQAQTLEPPAPRQGYYLSLGFYNGGSQHLGGRRGAGDLVSQRLHHPAGADADAPAGAGPADLHRRPPAKGEENGTTFGLGLEGQVALTGRLALNGGVGLGVLQLHDKRVMNEELRGAFGAEYSLAGLLRLLPLQAEAQRRPGPGADGPGALPARRRSHLGRRAGRPARQLVDRACPATSWTCPRAKATSGSRSTSGPAGRPHRRQRAGR